MSHRTLWRAVPAVAAVALSIAAFGVAPAAAVGTPVQTLIANDTLYIGATDAVDLMLLRQSDPGRVTLDMGADGVLEGKFFTSQFTHIDISLEGGNDRLLLTDVPVDVDARGGAGNDELHGGRGADVLDGGEGNDSLWAAGASTDTLLGGSGFGWDTLGFTPARDTMIADGGEGTDTLVAQGAPYAESMAFMPGSQAHHFKLVTGSGPALRDAVNVEEVDADGYGGDDTITVADGTGVTSHLDGGDGNDTVTGGDGTDWITGGPGADRLRGNGGRDLLSGFDGDLEVDAGGGPDSLIVDYRDQTTPIGEPAKVQTLDGGPGDDDYRFTGTALNDTLQLTDVDRITHGRQVTSHRLVGVELATLDLGASHDNLTASKSFAVPLDVRGGAGSDILSGGSSDDVFSGGEGNDTINGGDGDDRFVWGSTAGNDKLNGGPGDDLANAFGTQDDDRFIVYTPNVGPEEVARVGTTQRLLLTGLEGLRLETGEGADEVSTSVDVENAPSIPLDLRGGPGDDELYGGRSADLIDGGEGDDTLDGLGGDDAVNGGEGDDLVTWHPFYDSDVVDGGDGTDELRARASQLADDVRLAQGRDHRPQLLDVASGQRVAWNAVETVTVQLEEGNDKFSAGNGLRGVFDLRVDGGPGRDNLAGGDGDDLVSGGPGLDELDGRGGADTYQCGGSGDWFVEGPGDIVSDDCR